MLRPRGLCRPRLARRPTPAFHRALAICRLQPRRTPRIQNNSGLPQGPAGASAAASACGKLRFAGFGKARRGCMLDMRRREFITLLGGALTSRPILANAQPAPRVRTVGVLMGLADDAQARSRSMAFEQALETEGWPLGQNLRIEYRYAEGDSARIEAFAKELVEIKPDCIVGHSTPVVTALMHATRTISIVFV